MIWVISISVLSGFVTGLIWAYDQGFKHGKEWAYDQGFKDGKEWVWKKERDYWRNNQ